MALKQLLAEFNSAIDAEIALLEKESGDQNYELLSGQREEKSTGALYIFLLSDALHFPEDASGTLRVDGREIRAMVVSQEGNRIWLLLESLEPLPEYIPSARLIVNETDLLKRLKEKIESLASSSELGLASKVFGFEPITTVTAPLIIDLGERMIGQGKSVLEQCIGSDVTFVWGPPGTGKTFTIAALVAFLTSLSETALVTSHTHAAVEQALWALVEPPYDSRQAGFLYGSHLIEEGRILKIGELKSDKIPRSVHLNSYLQDKAKEREENLRLLEAEHEHILQHSLELKTALTPWLEMQQAELAYRSSQERHEKITAARNAAANQVLVLKTEAGRCEAERIKAEHSFFIVRHGRVQKSLIALTASQLALTAAEAAAGHADANAIRSERALGETHAHLLQSQQATQGLKPSDELEGELKTTEERIATLASEIEAIRNSAQDEAKQLVQNAAAIFVTLTKLYVDRDLLPDMKWDTVIVDEVSMAMPPLLAYAVSRARKRVVMVGDMYQLPPVIRSKEDSLGSILGKDIFELSGITEAIESGRDVPQLAKLISQRRMHPDIAEGAKVIIDGYKHLQNDSSILTRQCPSFVSSIGTDKALGIVDISDLCPWSGKMPGSLSRFNFISGQAAVELGGLYAKNLDQPKEKTAPPIGIITPYAAQRRYLNKLIQMCGLERWVTAGTVHTFQGNECDVIIFDSVLGEPHWTSRFTNPLDWQEVKRDLNVALTRARYQFVFVGDSRWMNKYARAGTGYGKLWSFLSKRAAKLQATDILGEGFKERIAKTVAGVKGWEVKATDKAIPLSETEFYGYFTADLMKAIQRVVLYTPFIGKTRWPSVAPYISLLRERNVEVFLLHKPLTDPEWRQADLRFGKNVLESLSRIGVKLIPLSGVHAKTIVIDSEIVYDGSLNWASQTSSKERMWRFKSSDMAKLIEKMLQLDPITEAFGEKDVGDCCPYCGGPLILINQAKQNPRDPYPLKLGCARWSEDKSSCRGYLRRVDGRVPFSEPPTCALGVKMRVNCTKEGRPWDWRCRHKGCRPIRWVRGDCLE